MDTEALNSRPVTGHRTGRRAASTLTLSTLLVAAFALVGTGVSTAAPVGDTDWRPGWCHEGEGVAIVIDFADANPERWPTGNDVGYDIRCLFGSGIDELDIASGDLATAIQIFEIPELAGVPTEVIGGMYHFFGITDFAGYEGTVDDGWFSRREGPGNEDRFIGFTYVMGGKSFPTVVPQFLPPEQQSTTTTTANPGTTDDPGTTVTTTPDTSPGTSPDTPPDTSPGTSPGTRAPRPPRVDTAPPPRAPDPARRGSDDRARSDVARGPRADRGTRAWRDGGRRDGRDRRRDRTGSTTTTTEPSGDKPDMARGASPDDAEREAPSGDPDTVFAEEAPGGAPAAVGNSSDNTWPWILLAVVVVGGIAVGIVVVVRSRRIV